MGLAVVIPYYKVSFLEQTISSLARQTCLDFNIYIGDDCSPNDPIEIIKKYAPKLKITYKRFDQNLGQTDLPKHWIRCINMIEKEDWIMLLGDDDYLQENVVESWYKHLDNFSNRTNVVRFASQLISENGEEISEKYDHPIWECASDAYFRKEQGLTRSSLSEYIFRKVEYLKYKFHSYPLGWHSDDRAWLEFSNQKPIYSINDSIVYVRISNQSISGNTCLWEEKVKSKKNFFLYLISDRKADFNKGQRVYLLKFFESFLKSERKLNLYMIFKLFHSYAFYTEPKESFRFIKRSIKEFIKGMKK